MLLCLCGERIYLARAVPELDGSGQLVGVISTARDITPLKRMESELAARAREFHTLVDNLPDVVVRYDLAVVATWEYSYLLFVTVLSAVIFHEIPDSWTIAGMTVIAVSGMLNLSSERIRRVLRRRPAKYV